MDLYICLSAVLTTTIILFVYCFYGSNATDVFLEYSNCAYESKWYESPRNAQHSILLVIGNGHRAMRLHGFGMFKVDLGTFTQVVASSTISTKREYDSLPFSDHKNSCQLLPSLQDDEFEELTTHMWISLPMITNSWLWIIMIINTSEYVYFDWIRIWEYSKIQSIPFIRVVFSHLKRKSSSYLYSKYTKSAKNCHAFILLCFFWRSYV